MARRKKGSRTGRKQSSLAKKSQPTHADCLRKALAWFASENSFTDLKLHGNVSWKAMHLVVLAVLWVWSDHRTLTGAFEQAGNLSQEILGSMAVSSYQGLTGTLRSYTASLLPLLWSHLHGLMERSAGEHWRIGKWLGLAVDGSRATTPRTASNERAFSIPNYGKGGKAKRRLKWKNKKRRSKKLSEPVKPQMWLTLIWHMGLKMPWCWRTGPSTSSERHHLLDLLQTLVFPACTLFCCDAGFVGYELWKTMLDHGHSFLIRVGGNVYLLRDLGTARKHNDLVYLWPNAAARKKEPPLVLRLLELQGPRGKIYLVTNVISERELSPKQSLELYRLRWGVELQFRALKQTFGRGTLRSRTPDNAKIELDWSLVGLWLIQLFAVKEQIKIDSPPAQSSVGLALNVIQDAMRNWSGAIKTTRELDHCLSHATKDTYLRRSSKRARYRPNYKDQPSATKPIIIRAKREQRQAYKALLAAA
jgi:hypothetical protein